MFIGPETVSIKSRKKTSKYSENYTKHSENYDFKNTEIFYKVTH